MYGKVRLIKFFRSKNKIYFSRFPNVSVAFVKRLYIKCQKNAHEEPPDGKKIILMMVEVNAVTILESEQ